MIKKLIKWLDNHAVQIADTPSQQADWRQIDLWRVIPFVLIHLACFAVFWVGFSWFAVGFAIALYALRMFAITGFYHRYFSHKTFRTSRLFQLLGAIAGATAVQRGPLWWACLLYTSRCV